MKKSIYLSKIEGLLKSAKDKGPDLCMLAYRYIVAAPEGEQSDLFEFFVENIRKTESDRSMEIPELITMGEVIDFSRETIEDMSDYLNMLYKRRNITKDVFYKTLWDYICTNSRFSCDKSRSVGIFNCIKMKKVPYLEISKAIAMDSAEFESYIDVALKSDQFDQLCRIMEFGFEQRTERFSMLLEIIESCTDVKMKTILFMLMSDIARQRDGRLMEMHERGFIDEDIA